MLAFLVMLTIASFAMMLVSSIVRVALSRIFKLPRLAVIVVLAALSLSPLKLNVPLASAIKIVPFQVSLLSILSVPVETSRVAFLLKLMLCS